MKSPREIAIIREATRISGEGIMAAMREARVGMHEHELQAPAESIFTKNGALGASDFALIATGRNTYYTHYNRNTSVLADGDLVQFDYAPDFKYYQSDVTRVFPANGTFSARQREMYEIYLELYQSVLTSIQVHTTPADCVKNALVKMDAIMVRYQFTDARIKAAAVNMVEGYRSRQASTLSLGHNVGLELHDVGGRQARRSSRARSSRSSRSSGSRRSTWASGSKTWCSSPKRVWKTCRRSCRFQWRRSRS